MSGLVSLFGGKCSSTYVLDPPAIKGRLDFVAMLKSYLIICLVLHVWLCPTDLYAVLLLFMRKFSDALKPHRILFGMRYIV